MGDWIGAGFWVLRQVNQTTIDMVMMPYIVAGEIQNAYMQTFRAVYQR
jgi:hypothetical protein